MSKRGLKRKADISTPRKHRMNPFAWVMFVFLCVYAACLLFPYLLALLSSFKSLSDFTDKMFSVTTPTLENYMRVFTEFTYPITLSDGSAGYYDFLGLTWNSISYALGGAVCLAIVPCVTAYCVAKFPYFFSKIMMVIVYVCMAIPIVGSTASEIQMTHMLGIYDTIPGMWFMKCSFLGIYFLIYHGAFKSIPEDYAEAAYMDGAGNFTIFFKLMVPMVKNIISLIIVLQFVALWSDYTGPLYFLPSKPTLSLTLLNFSALSGTSATMQMAACVLLCIPSLLLFAKFSEEFTSNLQMGGIKG